MMIELTSRKNPMVQQVRRLLTSRKERQQSGLFVAEGTKLFAEAARFWPGLCQVFHTPDVVLDIPQGVQATVVSEELMAYMSAMESPQGALFLCRLPEKKPLQVKPGMLLLDGIQDPGNLGTILRTADAFCVPVVLLEGCADPYSHKVVRASMGSVFRTVPQVASWEQVKEKCQKLEISIGVTALATDARDIRETALSQMAVVIGSEGQGVRREILQVADKKLIIPMSENCESLNAAVASAIVLWQMKG